MNRLSTLLLLAITLLLIACGGNLEETVSRDAEIASTPTKPIKAPETSTDVPTPTLAATDTAVPPTATTISKATPTKTAVSPTDTTPPPIGTPDWANESLFSITSQNYPAPNSFYEAVVTFSQATQGNENYNRLAVYEGETEFLVAERWEVAALGGTQLSVIGWSEGSQSLYFQSKTVPDGCPLPSNVGQLQKYDVQTKQLSPASFVGLPNPAETTFATIDSADLLLTNASTNKETRIPFDVPAKAWGAGNLTWLDNQTIQFIVVEDAPCPHPIIAEYIVDVTTSSIASKPQTTPIAPLAEAPLNPIETPAPILMCTPPVCESGNYSCGSNDGCPGGCGTICLDDATQTPATSPMSNAINGSAHPNVAYFRLAGTPLKPTDNLKLEWSVSGVNSIQIERQGGEWGEAAATWDVGADGELWINLPPEVGGWPISYRLTSTEDTTLSSEMTFFAPCQWEWVFDFDYPYSGCPSESIKSNGSQQNFERGFMIWIESQDLILWSTWNGLENGILTDTFDPAIDATNDPSISAPDGFFQPEYGFGKLWRTELRGTLGWATDWGSDYTVLRQSMPVSRYGYQEWLSMREGGLITLNHPDPIWVIDYSGH